MLNAVKRADEAADRVFPGDCAAVIRRGPWRAAGLALDVAYFAGMDNLIVPADFSPQERFEGRDLRIDRTVNGARDTVQVWSRTDSGVQELCYPIGLASKVVVSVLDPVAVGVDFLFELPVTAAIS